MWEGYSWQPYAVGMLAAATHATVYDMIISNFKSACNSSINTCT